jgi:hypothetical protein
MLPCLFTPPYFLFSLLNCIAIRSSYWKANSHSGVQKIQFLLNSEVNCREYNSTLLYYTLVEFGLRLDLMRRDLLTNENLIVTKVFCGHVVLSTALLTFTLIIRFDLRVRQWLRARTLLLLLLSSSSSSLSSSSNSTAESSHKFT